MINSLNARYSKHIAWLMFLLFYGELAGSLYAGSVYNSSVNRTAVNSYISGIPAGKPSYNPLIRPDVASPVTESAINKVAAVPNEEEQAFIDGPGQPEMSSFRSVGADNMVNMFTGDFSYSVPLLDVGGYPINLFYNAGVSMDQEASWVGLGWNLNPGTISRNMRGLPDDFNEVDTITNTQSMKSDLTIGVTGSKSKEFIGMPALSSSGYNLGIFYNNRRGLGLEAGINGELSIHRLLSLKTKDEATFKDTVTAIKLEGGINLNSQNGMGLSGGFSVYSFNQKKFSQVGLSTSADYNSRRGLTDLKIGGEFRKYTAVSENCSYGLALSQMPIHGGGTLSFARSSFVPSIRVPVTRFNQMYSVKFGKEQTVAFVNTVLSGYVNETRISEDDRTQRKPAYGYMYYEAGKDNKDALLDFNRLNDGVYTLKRPVISLPVYTYDVFSINGEGTGGTFRGYRSNMGYVHDNETKDKTSSLSISLDLGVGRLFHGGTTLGGIYSPSEVGEWKIGNVLSKQIAFKNTDSIYQSFYFKNPAEKAIIDEDYYASVAGDQLIRPYLIGTSSPAPMLDLGFQVYDQDRKIERVIKAKEAYRKQRDKRTQVITYLTAQDAERIGLDSVINSYAQGMFRPGDCVADNIYKMEIPRYMPADPTFLRKGHHISEVGVLEPDGRRYVYGIPVYQIKQKEVTFSTNNTGDNNQLVSYNPSGAHPENSVNNNSGRDGLYQSQELGGYAHSFLLTGILSPDYVDVTGNGITDDDLGNAVKFNYTRHGAITSPGGNYYEPFKWRMPMEANKANFNEGLKADSRDNKGLYTYGEKELWYTHSIESKNMVAIFYTGDRTDGNQVAGENGGMQTSGIKLQRLQRIDLYSKADLVNNNEHAKPIKSVHFAYSYKLCLNYPLNSHSNPDSTGKLTLDSLWFSYNGMDKQQRNKYKFAYGTGVKNPSYNSTQSDKWGNYKPNTENPKDNGVAISNADFPYTIQDSIKSNQYAGAWNLEKILMPGGGMMQVTYEADDYAFVQDKRASQMTAIAGFGKTAAGPITSTLYSGSSGQFADPALSDHRFVFFDAGKKLENKEEVSQRYLQGFKQLLLRIWVEMPRPQITSSPAYEPVTVYGAIKSYGIVASNDHQFYVELEPTTRGGSPIMETVMQFLKDQLPARAYPGYEVTGNGLVQLVGAVWGMLTAFLQGVVGFEQALKMSGSCKKVKLAYARLNNPELHKIGGGHRVKRVIISDNWSKMTKRGDLNGLPDSYYGQEYDYTTTEVINNTVDTISSGVATYEPAVGNEENPLREILKYSDGQFLGPTDHSNVELPVAETFFPSPMVGYSKVSVRSIHNKSTKRIKSGVGLQETEFYTTKDFPVISEFTSFDPQSRKHHSPPFLNQILNFDKKDYVTLTQGFRVILNDMNGKMKSQTSYPEDDYKNPVTSVRYYYRMKEVGANKFRLDNILPVISGPDGVVTQKLIGKEVEVMNDFREHFTYTYAKQIPLNIEVFPVPPFLAFLPSLFRMGFRDESMFRSATTMKVVNEFGILDSVVSNDKGSVVGTKNLVYDAETGDVLLSRTTNEFKDPVYSFNYPAWWRESGMQPAYRNIDLTYSNVLFRNGRIESSHVNMAHFESGDELYVTHSNKQADETIGCVIGAGLPTQIPLSTALRIWAVHTTKDPANNAPGEFVFIDRQGNPYSADGVTLRVIRSGKRNLSGTSIGTVVSLTTPIRLRNGKDRLIFDDTTNVINANAMMFREKWRASQMFYTVDSTVMTVRQTPVLNMLLWPDASFSALARREFDGNRNVITNFFPAYDSKVLEIEKYRRYEDKFKYDNLSCGFCHNNEKYIYDQNSWMRFNLAPYETALEGATILNASLKLVSHELSHEAAKVPIGFHYLHLPHRNSLPSSNFMMSMKISRMLSTQWPTTDAQWKNIFLDGPSQAFFDYTTYTPSFPNSATDFSGSYTVDVTSVARTMVANRHMQVPALKLSFYQPGDNITWDRNDGRSWRFCFNLTDRSCSDCGYEGSALNLAYYKCSPSDPIVYQGGAAGAPTVPPAGSVYCSGMETTTMCLSVFDKKLMNPYIQGLLGNWRPLRSYVYYGERRSSDAITQTNIRKDGVIKDFFPFWLTNATRLDTSISDKWVWNSVITQYNRKGAELENHDALGRYNSGVYGYQETLPVAVVNNSRLRLAAYDGFEDYFYTDNPCGTYCYPHHRHFNTGLTGSNLVDTVAHTGRYSLRVPASATQSIPIHVSAEDLEAQPLQRVKIVNTPYDIVTVTPNGNGLTGEYYYKNVYASGGSPAVTRVDQSVNLSFQGRSTGPDCMPNAHGNLPAPPLFNCNYIVVVWKAKIQVSISGFYRFGVARADDRATMKVNGNVVFDYELNKYLTAPQAVYLTKGTLHTVEIKYSQETWYGYIDLIWQQPNIDGSASSNPYLPIPTQHFYSVGQESRANGAVDTVTYYCNKVDQIQGIEHAMIDSFNLVPGQKMVASVWVRQGDSPHYPASYSGVDIKLKLANNSVVASFAPKERVIEGWQLYEAIFDVPQTNGLKLDIYADEKLYVDDLRFHPFNGNMKSFVYDPVTLRLSAELDENNYATFYEYDDEGTPARVKKETRQGIKTISETRSATQKINIGL